MIIGGENSMYKCTVRLKGENMDRNPSLLKNATVIALSGFSERDPGDTPILWGLIRLDGRFSIHPLQG
jgi:hypothetical protein